MKNTIAIILILISLNCFGQTNGTNGKVEPVKLETPVDSIAIVALRDYNTFFVWLQNNVSKANYDKLTPEQVLTMFFNWSIEEWNRKKKK